MAYIDISRPLQITQATLDARYGGTDHMCDGFYDGVCNYCGEFKGNKKMTPLSLAYTYVSSYPYFVVPAMKRATRKQPLVVSV